MKKAGLWLAVLAGSSAFGAEWTYDSEAKRVSDGVWTFAAETKTGKFTVGECKAVPEAATELDFSKPVRDAEGKTYVIARLDPKFGIRNPFTKWSPAGREGFCDKVGKLTLPGAGLDTIEPLAFAGCTNATGRVSLPSTLVSLGSGVFTKCRGLEIPGDVLPKGVTTLASDVFRGANLVGEVDLTAITKVEGAAFKESNVRSVRFGPKLQSIAGGYGSGCFVDCKNLECVTFAPSSSVAFDGTWAFHGCTSIEELDLSCVTSFTQMQDSGDACAPFHSCTKLRKVSFGPRLAKISSCVFGCAAALMEIHFSGKPPEFAMPVLNKVEEKRLLITYVHLDEKSPDDAEALAAWGRLTAGGKLETDGSTWSEAMAGKSFAKRPLLLFKRPTVSVSEAVDADEGTGKSGGFILSRRDDDPMCAPIFVRYATGGTAKPGRTYCSVWDTTKIPAGERSVRVRVTPLDDPKTTSDATVTLALVPDAGYVIGGEGKAELKVINGAAYGGHHVADAGPWNLIAHMGGAESGGSGNTKKAAEFSVAHGYAFENDVQMTEDGRFYLAHDPMKEIAGRATFTESLELVQEGVLYKVDAKCGLKGLDRMIAEVKANGAHKRGLLAFNSWDREFALKIHEELPECLMLMPVMLGGDGKDLEKEAQRTIAWVKNCKAQGISIMWNEKVCTEAFFGKLNDAGLIIDVWTIDDMKTAKEAINRGARWVTTNYPLRMSAEFPPAEAPRVVGKISGGK